MPQKKYTNPIDKRIGQQIKNIRKYHNLSINDLAKITEVNYRTIWNCENGLNTLSVNLLIKICKVLEDKYNDDISELIMYIIINPIEK